MRGEEQGRDERKIVAAVFSTVSRANCVAWPCVVLRRSSAAADVDAQRAPQRRAEKERYATGSLEAFTRTRDQLDMRVVGGLIRFCVLEVQQGLHNMNQSIVSGLVGLRQFSSQCAQVCTWDAARVHVCGPLSLHPVPRVLGPAAPRLDPLFCMACFQVYRRIGLVFVCLRSATPSTTPATVQSGAKMLIGSLSTNAAARN